MDEGKRPDAPNERRAASNRDASNRDAAGRPVAGNQATGRRATGAERIEASHALARAWERAVVDLAFSAGGRPVRIDTERTDAVRRADAAGRADATASEGSRGEGEDDADLVTVHGRVGEGLFAVELPANLLAALVGGLPDAPDPLALAPADAALVLEHALTAGIERAEADLGEPIQIEGLEDGPLVSELQPFVLAVWAEKRRHLARAVVGDALHMRILSEWLGDRAMDDEFDAGPVTRVEIGPITLNPDDWDQIEPGDALAIGTEPGVNLKGRLVRPTGRALPVEIDTSHVIAAGPLLERAAGAPGGEMQLGVAIGTVRLTPTHLARAATGARFIMERNANNECALMESERVVARGALTLIDGQLGVEVRALGAGDAPSDPDAAPRPIAGAIRADRPGEGEGDGADDEIESEPDDIDADAVVRTASLRRAG